MLMWWVIIYSTLNERWLTMKEWVVEVQEVSI